MVLQVTSGYSDLVDTSCVRDLRIKFHHDS